MANRCASRWPSCGTSVECFRAMLRTFRNYSRHICASYSRSNGAWRTSNEVPLMLEGYEFFLCPVNQLPPFSIDEEWPREVAGVRMKSCYYITINQPLGDLGPAGFTPEGLPVGLQIVGCYRDDFGVLQLAHAFEQATQFWKRHPALAA